jgi:hypothetical protein
MSSKYRQWTVAEIALVRKAARNGLSAGRAAELLGPEWNPDLVRSRASRLGVRFAGRSAHDGSSTLSLGKSPEITAIQAR